MTFLEAVAAVQETITIYAVQPLLILFIGVFIGKVLEEVLLFAFEEFKRTETAYTFTAYVLKWFVYIATVLLALHSVGLLAIVLWFFAGAVVTFLLVSVVLAVFDFFPNFWHYHAVKKKFKPGAKIKTRFAEGTVVGVQLVDLHVKTEDGDTVFIPNSTVYSFLRK
jgi:small-conductance mechanosensitive channel